MATVAAPGASSTMSLLTRATLLAAELSSIFGSLPFFVLSLALSWYILPINVTAWLVVLGCAGVAFAIRRLRSRAGAIAPASAAVLITGCSSGFGRQAALEFVRRGVFVFATVRKQEDADALRDAAGDAAATRLHVLLMDVTSDTQVGQAVETVKRVLARMTPMRLKAVINNAGYGQAGNLETLPIEHFERQLATNLTGALRVTQAFLPFVREAGALAAAAGEASARIVMVSSFCGRVCVPGQSAYCISKFGMEALADGFRLEIPRIAHVDTVVIQPGGFKTDFIKNLATAAENNPSVNAFVQNAQKYERLIPPADPVIESFWHACFDPMPFTRMRIGFDCVFGVPLALALPDVVRDAILRLAAL
eukprot:a4687_15.p1 GENE.a4687_15~~a4687_15.p1  ORF type:complete len:377 (+),score=133.25 a4687_15:38-1132(+)